MKGKYEKKYDIQYSTHIDQKHFKWAKPYINSSIKTLFIPGIRFGREIVEMIQRMDIDYETVTIDRDWDLNKWGLGDFYHVRASIDDLTTLYQNLENVLTSDEEFDVMILPGLNGWGFFTPKTRQAILKRVEEGTGLILIKPFNGEGMGEVEELEKLSPLKNLFEEGFVSDKLAGDGFPEVKYDMLRNDGWVPEDHYITKGIPFDIFPYHEMAYYPYETDDDVIIKSESGKPIAAVKEYGKGRVVAFGYYPRNILPQHAKFTGRESFYESIMDNLAGAKHSLPFNYLEYFYGLLYRSMIWVSRKEAKCQIDNVLLSKDKVSVGTSANDDYDYNIRIIDEYDNVVFENRQKGNEFALPEWLNSGGRYRADVFVMEDCKTVDWATISLNYPLKTSVREIKLNSSVLAPGETFNASINVEGTIGKLEIQVIDDYDRVLHVDAKEITGSGWIDFNYLVEEVRSLHLKLRTVVTVDNHIIQRKDSNTVIVTPQKRKIDDFEIFMNSQNRGQGDMWDLQRKKSLEIGVTGAFPGSDKVLTMSGADGLGIYWYHRFPYVERKEKYLKSGDKKDLCRLPCLNDPEFWKVNQDDILREVEKNKKYGPVSYYANDEGSLTCYTDELELCFCHHCMSGMREWLKGEYSSIEELNNVWGTGFKTWEEVMPYTYREAIKSRDYASWGDHRRFMELTFAGAYKKIRDYVKKVDPVGIIRMSGCQASTAYSGYDYYQLHKYIGYFEAYPVGNQYEYHRSFAQPDTIIGGWLGYGAKGATIKNRLWYALYHGLTLISLFAEYSHINPDFTFFSGAVDTSEVIKEIRREGIGKLLLHTTKRDSLGIAVHYSLPSIHGTYIMGQKDRFEKNRQGWLDLLEDSGYQYNFIATQQIEGGELVKSGYKVLILPYSIALSDGETEEIKRFVEKGGVVIADAQTGLMDQHCKLYDEGRLDDLFGIRRLVEVSWPFNYNREVIPCKGFEYFESSLGETPEDRDTGLKIAEGNIRATTANAAYTDSFTEKVGIVCVNEYGKGKGVYLNLSMDSYSTQRSSEMGGYYLREAAKKILNMCGVAKPAALEKMDGTPAESDYETIYYSDNSAKYFGILRGFGKKLNIGYDGLEIGSAKTAKGLPDSLRIKLRDKAHIYDVRAKKYLGYSNELETQIATGDTGVFSLLPYTVEGIDISTLDTAARGGKFKLDIRLQSSKPSGEYSNVISINVYNPSGDYEWIYSENVSIEGLEFSKEFIIPFNGETGKWKVVVKDVATGITNQKEFEIV